MRTEGRRPRRLGAALSCFALVGAFAGSCARRAERSELHIVWSSDILALDPDARFEAATDTYAMNVFEPLVRYDRKMSFAPVLAIDWENPDGKTWRFHLRPGVRFHDGTPLLADDVVFTIHRILESSTSDLRAYLDAVSSVRAADTRTVEIVSGRPAGLLAVLSSVYVLPQAALRAQGEKAFFEHPIGTGPYRLVEWKPGRHLKLERWDGWWGGKAPFHDVTFLVARDEEMWTLTERNAPSLLVAPTTRSYLAHKGDRRFTLLSRPGMSVNYIGVNVNPGPSRPLADLRVRKALRAAIDYPRLVEKVSQGQAFPASQLVTSDIIGYNPSLTVRAFEPGAARRLLAEAGHPDGITVTMNCMEGPSPLAEELVRQLSEAGIRVTLRPSTSAVLYQRAGTCDGDLYLMGWICSTGDAGELFEGNFDYREDGTGGTPPPCGYWRPELEALIDRAATTLDPEARRDVLQQAMKLVVEDLPWIPLLVTYDRYAVTPGLVWEPRPDSEVYLPDVKAK